jgi:SAM-dependent methyltransferase
MSERPGFEALGLACPACRGPLDWVGSGAWCLGCGREYPASDGILDLRLGQAGERGYDAHYFGTLPQVEGRHFWFVARREIIFDACQRFIPDLAGRRMFDIGCGSGGLLAFLASRGVPVSGACDAYPQALALARRQLDAPLVLLDEGRWPSLAAGSQSLVGLFDVLEHLDDDRGVLAWLHSVLEPGGVLVLTVPAHPFLFDEADELAQHRRRYTRSELAAKLREAGFELRRLTHFMASLVPAMLALRALGRLVGGKEVRARRDRELSVIPLLNPLLLGLLRLEGRWIRHAPLPWGASLLAVACRRR